MTLRFDAIPLGRLNRREESSSDETLFCVLLASLQECQCFSHPPHGTGLISVVPEDFGGFRVVVLKGLRQTLGITFQVAMDIACFITAPLKEIAKQVDPFGRVWPVFDVELLEARVIACLVIQQPECHQDDRQVVRCGA